MKESGVQIKVTMTPSLYEQTKMRAERMGLTIASYLRMLTINDLRLGEEEKLGLDKVADRKSPALNPTQPQVIVVNNDGDYRPRERGAGTSHLEGDSHAASQGPQTVRLDDLLRIL